MKKSFIPFLSFIIMFIALSSCRQDTASPIKNVRFDPGNLNRVLDGSPCITYSYLYEGEQQSLGTVFTKQVLVAFKDGLTLEEQQKVIEKYGFVESIVSQTATNTTLMHTLVLVDGLNCKQAENAIAKLAKDDDLVYVAPYFMADVNGTVQLLGLSNEVIVTTETGGEEQLAELASTFNFEVLMPLGGNAYLIKVITDSDSNTLEVANALAEQEGIETAEPDFIISI